MIKTFEQFVNDIYSNAINESFESNTIQEFINYIKSSDIKNLYMGFYGGGFEEIVDGYCVKEYNNLLKYSLETIYETLKLGSFKEDWIYKFKQFDNKKIINKEDLFNFFKEQGVSLNVDLQTLNKWCNNNNTLILSIHDEKYMLESDYIICIFIDPEKAQDVVKKWNEIKIKKNNTYQYKHIKNEEENKQYISDYNNKILDIYKQIASKEQYNTLIEFINWFINTKNNNFEYIVKYINSFNTIYDVEEYSFNEIVKLAHKDIDDKKIKEIRSMSKRKLYHYILKGFIGDILKEKFERLYKDDMQMNIIYKSIKNEEYRKMMDNIYDELHKNLDETKLKELKEKINL